MKNISLYLSLYHLICLAIRGTDFYYNNFTYIVFLDFTLYVLMIYSFFAFKLYDNNLLLIATISNVILWIYNEIAIALKTDITPFTVNYLIITLSPLIVIIEDEINKRYFKGQ